MAKNQTFLNLTPTVWNDVTAVRVQFTMVSQDANVAVQGDGLLRQNYDFTVGDRKSVV